MFGYIDMKGKFAIKPQFHLVNHFRGGYATVISKDHDRAVIDKAGDIVLPYQKCDAIIQTLQHTFFIEHEGISRIYDNKNHVVGMFKAAVIMKCSFDDECDLYKFSPDPQSLLGSGLYGIVDAFGNVIIEPKYVTISGFSEGVAFVWSYKKGSRGNCKGTIINTQDKVVFDKFWCGEEMLHGLMAIDQEDGTRSIINTKFETLYTANWETDQGNRI